MTLASPYADVAYDGSPMTDRYRLRRFVDAQQPVLNAVSEELHKGVKQSHWMWFIFPQIQGLGKSAISKEFSLASLDEARAYLAHPILGKRLIEMTRWMNAIEGRTAHDILGSPDDKKFHSSMTLFALAADRGNEPNTASFGGSMAPSSVNVPTGADAHSSAPSANDAAAWLPDSTEARQVFLDALSKFFGGAFDSGTLSRLGC